MAFFVGDMTHAARPASLFNRSQLAFALMVACLGGCAPSCLGFGTAADEALPRRWELVRAELVPSRIDYRVTAHDELAASLRASDRSHLTMFPKGSRVDLQLRLTNVSREPLTIAYPSGCYHLSFELQGGRGVVFAYDTNMTRYLPPRRGKRRVLAPGEGFQIDIPYLDLDQHADEWRAYLSQTSSVMARAKFEARCSDEDLAFITSISPQIEIRVQK